MSRAQAFAYAQLGLSNAELTTLILTFRAGLSQRTQQLIQGFK